MANYTECTTTGRSRNPHRNLHPMAPYCIPVPRLHSPEERTLSSQSLHPHSPNFHREFVHWGLHNGTDEDSVTLADPLLK